MLPTPSIVVRFGAGTDRRSIVGISQPTKSFFDNQLENFSAPPLIYPLYGQKNSKHLRMQPNANLTRRNPQNPRPLPAPTSLFAELAALESSGVDSKEMLVKMLF